MLALNKTYGEDVIASGPSYKSYKTNRKLGKMVIYFNYAESGFKISKGDKLKGFAIAGEDLSFVWADAEIKRDRFLGAVWCKCSAEPQVRCSQA